MTARVYVNLPEGIGEWHINDMGYSKMELEKQEASSEWTIYIVLLGEAAGKPNHQPD